MFCIQNISDWQDSNVDLPEMGSMPHHQGIRDARFLFAQNTKTGKLFKTGNGEIYPNDQKYTKTRTIYIPNGFTFLIYQHFSFKGPQKYVYEN
jgi:hypothetical protein